MWISRVEAKLFFFFKQKTADEMRISDWSSDVCSSDLPEAEPRAITTPAAAWIVGDMLADPNARVATFGLDNALRLPFWAAVKTGTSKAMRDNWCIGYSTRYTVGVWVGNKEGDPMRAVSGTSGAAPVWRDVMLAIPDRSEEHTSELQSLMRISYDVFCLKKTKH